MCFARPPQGEWTLDAKGQPSDPVTLYVHCTPDDLEKAFVASGWTQADPRSRAANAKYLKAATNEEFLRAATRVLDDCGVGSTPSVARGRRDRLAENVNKMPVSPQTYGGRPMLMAFERNNDPLGGREHFRVFDTGTTDAQGRPVLAIAASRDSGLRVAPEHPETGFLFHTVDPDVRGERGAVLASLTAYAPTARVSAFPLRWFGNSSVGAAVQDGQAFDVVL